MNLFSAINYYGLIISFSILISVYLINKKSKSLFPNINIDNLAFYVTVAGIIGARLWHVITDYYFYQNSLINVFYIWNGGLSIIGGIIAGLITLTIFSLHSKYSFFLVSDLIIFGLPFGQALGRLGNFVNQELYGLPTRLPWGINIATPNRNLIFGDSVKFHPLFLYEMILTFAFGIWVWWIFKNDNKLIGTGWLFSLYGAYYFTFRFLLDFLRIYSQPPVLLNLHLNQVVALALTAVFVIHLFKLYEKNKEKTA